VTGMREKRERAGFCWGNPEKRDMEDLDIDKIILKLRHVSEDVD